MAAAIGRMHLLMAKNINLLRSAVTIVTKNLKGKTSSLPHAQVSAVPAYARLPRQPIHPAAFLKQSRRWLSTRTADAARQFSTGATARADYASTRTGAALARSSGRAPFASTLRPRLTGGAIPRTQGGYSIGGGKRYFSSSPAPAAEVIHNVSQSMRAFMLGGKTLHYDGIDSRTGEKRFKAVSATQAKATRGLNELPRATPGSFIDFNVNPTITAMCPASLSSVAGFDASKPSGMETLHSDGLLDVLSLDFSRALHELALTMTDLRSLSALGDLPITYHSNTLRVHFPGTDPETVSCLADELGIKRGVVGQDPDFDAYIGTEIALLFPFADSATASTVSSLHGLYAPRQQQWEASNVSSATLSDTGLAYDQLEELSSLASDAYESIPETTASQSLVYHSSAASPHLTSSNLERSARGRGSDRPLEYHDEFEGIYRFIELCDHARS